jgi:hypothetical protein
MREAIQAANALGRVHDPKATFGIYWYVLRLLSLNTFLFKSLVFSRGFDVFRSSQNCYRCNDKTAIQFASDTTALNESHLDRK